MIVAENVTHMFNVNWDSLKTYVNTELLSFPIAGSERWGGWSVLSQTGSYTDGWGKGHQFFKKDSNQNIYFDKDAYSMSNITPSDEHVNFTDIVTDDIKSIVTQMRDLGFDPYRTRITRLPAGQKSLWHVDSEPNITKLRLHFVIDTNDNCFFEHEAGKIHLAERNVYIINVNGLHRVTNAGTSDRIHIISDMTDNNKLSKLHGQ